MALQLSFEAGSLYFLLPRSRNAMTTLDKAECETPSPSKLCLRSTAKLPRTLNHHDRAQRVKEKL